MGGWVEIKNKANSAQFQLNLPVRTELGNLKCEPVLKYKKLFQELPSGVFANDGLSGGRLMFKVRLH